MSDYLIKEETLIDIADAIRDKIVVKNLFDKDNLEIVSSSGVQEILSTDTGIAVVANSARVELVIDIGEISDKLGKIFCFSWENPEQAVSETYSVSGAYFKPGSSGSSSNSAQILYQGTHIMFSLPKVAPSLAYKENHLRISFIINNASVGEMYEFKNLMFSESFIPGKYSSFGHKELINTVFFSEKIEEIYNDAKKFAEDTFWTVYQIGGKRTYYNYGFYAQGGSVWDDRNFKPKYDIKPTSMEYFMYQADVNDFVGALEEAGIGFDTSSCTSFSRAFYNCKVNELPVLDMHRLSSTSNAQHVFSSASNLKKIQKLIFCDSGLYIPNTFSGCRSLTYMRIEGAIGINFNVSVSPLDLDSIKSIISALIDYSGSKEYTYTLTLSDTSKALLQEDTSTVEYTDASGATSTYTYLELIDKKKWNLA